MKINRTLLLLSLFLTSHGMLFSQYVVKSQEELGALKKLPLEKIYVHGSSALLFPGEYLYYSIYVLNAATNKLDNISSMAYVELVGEDLQVVLRQKVRLEGGRGQGDFFVPVTVPSGIYKLIAYTQWMKNAGTNQLFQDDILVVNPYRVAQETMLSQPQPSESDTTTALTEDRSIQLITDKTTYGKRDLVLLTPKNFRGPLGYGKYSISVRKKEDLSPQRAMKAREFTSKYLDAKKTISQGVNDSIYLPEQRGELFFGAVTDGQNRPVAGETVVISIPGKDFQLKSAITDDQGMFYTYVNKAYEAPMILAQVSTDTDSIYETRFKVRSSLDYDELRFANALIRPEDKKKILQRSVHNQIENGYYSVKPDSILSIDTLDPFDGGLPEVVVLDDFTRFPTLPLGRLKRNIWRNTSLWENCRWMAAYSP